MMSNIFVIPDTQVKDGVPTDHLGAAGRFIVAKQPDIIVHLGDHWDLPSLSSYDKAGSKSFEGRRYLTDVRTGNDAMAELLAPINEYNESRKRQHMKQYKPRMIFLMGNHEARIMRAINDDPKLDGVLGYHDLDLEGWEVYDYQHIVDVEGILFSHNFVNPDSLKKGLLCGTMDNKLKVIGQSFVMGHQQHLQIGTRHPHGRNHIGIVAGAYYQHEEEYMGPQGNHHWRGCFVLNDVHEGYGDPMFLSLKYMMRKYA